MMRNLTIAAIFAAANGFAALAQPVPSQAELGRAAAEVFDDLGEKRAEFRHVPNEKLLVIQHEPSGLTCSAPLHIAFRVWVVTEPEGDYVKCSATAAEFTDLWTVFPTADGSFADWFEFVVTDNARIHNGTISREPRGAQDHEVVRFLEAQISIPKDWVWIEVKGSSVFLGAAEIAGRRYLYFIGGATDAPEALGPLQWLSQINDLELASSGETGRPSD